MDKFVQKMSKDIFSRGFYCAATISLLFIDCGSALQLPPWTYGETQHRKLNGCADCPWEVIAPIGADMSCFTCNSGKLPFALPEATPLGWEYYSCFLFQFHWWGRDTISHYSPSGSREHIPVHGYSFGTQEDQPDTVVRHLDVADDVLGRPGIVGVPCSPAFWEEQIPVNIHTPWATR